MSQNKNKQQKLFLSPIVAALAVLGAGDADYLPLTPSLGHHLFPVYPRDIAGNTFASRYVSNNDRTGLFHPSSLTMSYNDSDLKAVLVRFHSQLDTDTRRDILKELSDNQLSRVVIQGVKYEFEREGLEGIALVVLDVIARDSRSKLAHDVHGETYDVAVKDEKADGRCDVVIKMEQDSDDDNGFNMIKFKRKTMQLSLGYRNLY